MPPWMTGGFRIAVDIIGFLQDPKVGFAVLLFAAIIAVVRRGGKAGFWAWRDVAPSQWAFVVLCAIGIVSFGLNIARQAGWLGATEFNYNATQKLEAVVSAAYDNQTVVLDGRDFENCTFDNVTFIYKGTAPFVMTDPHFVNGGTIVIGSPNPVVNLTIALAERVMSIAKGVELRQIPWDEFGKRYGKP
jgi:hypothetical protein